MSARGSSIGANDLTRAPYAPHTEQVRHDFNSASMQSGIHTSPGLFATAIAGSRGEERPRNFFTQFLIDVLAVLVAFTLIIATGLGLGFAVFALLFVQL